MPATFRINLSGTTPNSINDLLDYVRATQVDARHVTMNLVGGVSPNQVSWPITTGCLFALIIFGQPASDGGDVTILWNSLPGSIVKANYPSIASGDKLMLLVPKTKEILVAFTIDMVSTKDVSEVDVYFF